ncbi:hypothetical protein CROQUDRAFT_718371 [Cronartium quercuum f. sp. fusiforme G11]|uniref:FAS1 domain-containing protein n=1 Tax=Cronartium quercuum f. sp. fusiforme G11 TaxID=708437 RepID=A0A9P6T6H6_9BASI|nr:hypothetical protein CROQUDRAFT_718371 [Cronartium quercuum f. sp. fusiforme G11]
MPTTHYPYQAWALMRFKAQDSQFVSSPDMMVTITASTDEDGDWVNVTSKDGQSGPVPSGFLVQLDDDNIKGGAKKPGVLVASPLVAELVAATTDNETNPLQPPSESLATEPPPSPNISNLASLSELSSLVSTVNGASPQPLTQLDQTPGLTIFAPINLALCGTPNVSSFQAMLLNHLVNSTVLYSAVIANATNATSAGGALLTFASSSGSETITLGTKTLKMAQSDILINNGVIHLVAGVLRILDRGSAINQFFQLLIFSLKRSLK